MGTTALLLAAIAAYGAGHSHGQPQPRQQPSYQDVGGAIVGRASVIDGDTIEVQGRRIRFFGIDAPESSQSCQDAGGNPYPCGRRSAMALDGKIEGRTVSCAPRDTDRYGRTVAVCSTGGVDLNAWMVRSGHAVAYTQYGRDYADAEAAARANRLNIWQGPFENPSDYRRQHTADRGYRRAGGF